jgi:hypothetical protein
MLQGPEYPHELEYLRGWTSEMFGRSGASMSGLLPLSFTTIAAWSELKGVSVEPHEVDALIQLDSAMLYPGDA